MRDYDRLARTMLTFAVQLMIDKNVDYDPSSTHLNEN
jgi:hypothetical protein